MKLIVDYGTLLAVRLILLPLVILPDKIALIVARSYVSLIFLLIPRLNEAAKSNIKLVFPKKSQADKDKLRKLSKNVLAENILGFVRIPRLTPEKAKIACDYTEAIKTLERLRKKSNGVGTLIPAIHFDAFELFVQVHALNHRPAYILGRGTGLKNFDLWWNGQREIFGNKIFSRKGGYKEIVKRLKEGQDVILLCDQNVKLNHAVFARFFGVKAATTKTIALAALRTGAPIMFGSPLSISLGKFEITAEEVLHPNDIEGDTEEKILACTEDLHRHFERQILKRPEAWFWIHRRWKTRPEGDKKNIYGK